MRSALVLVAVLGLSVVPARLHAQDAATRIEAARSRALAAGIPTALIEARIAEGRAKGVSLDRVADVVERRVNALTEARAAMQFAPGVTQADLSAGADAVEVGIDAAALRAVIEEARAEDRAVAIAVLTYLHGEGGLPVDEAVLRVREAIGRGSDALMNLPAQASARARPGRPGGVGPAGGQGGAQGPPAGIPAPGERPGRGRPDNPGRPGKGGGSGI